MTYQGVVKDFIILLKNLVFGLCPTFNFQRFSSFGSSKPCWKTLGSLEFFIRARLLSLDSISQMIKTQSEKEMEHI